MSARPRATVLTVSDRSARGERADATGPRLVTRLGELGFDATLAPPVPDEREGIAGALRALAATSALVVTTGGTGFAPRDVTPEATRDVIDREAPGLAEEMRRRTAAAFPRAILSRGIAGTCGACLVVNLPGSPGGALDCLDALADVLPHAVKVLRGGLRDCADDPPGRAGGAA